MKGLTPRQRALYKYLIKHSEEWVFQVKICTDLAEWYDLEFPFMDFHNTKARHFLTADIRALNESDEVEVIILSGVKGVKIATKEEFEYYIKGEISAAIRRLKRAKQKIRKGHLDGQLKFETTEDQAVIKAFIN